MQRSPLPLQEEGNGLCADPHYAEPIGVDGTQPSSVAEVAGGVVRWADLEDLVAGVPLRLAKPDPP